MRYDLMNNDALPYRRAYVGSFDTIGDAIAAIPGAVAFWDVDTDNDAADAITTTGSLYSVERRA